MILVHVYGSLQFKRFGFYLKRVFDSIRSLLYCQTVIESGELKKHLYREDFAFKFVSRKESRHEVMSFIIFAGLEFNREWNRIYSVSKGFVQDSNESGKNRD